MAIQSIRVKNLLSFDDVFIDDIQDINCIVGKNNVGKSNLLKIMRYFYSKLNGERVLPPELYSNYNSFGSITIRFNTTRIKSIVTGKNNNSAFLKHIYNTLFPGQKRTSLSSKSSDDSYLDLTLTIFKDDSTKWSTTNQDVLSIIYILYPFIDIETRHIDLYDWNRIWGLISRLSSFNVKRVNSDEVINYLDEKISNGSGHYKDYIDKVESIVDTKSYSYRDKVLSYIKVGLKGHDFTNSGQELGIQSDGTNSHRFIEIILKLLIVLTRREYITPVIYIDEPEVGLHPKLNEDLIQTLHKVYIQFNKTKDKKEPGKYKTPYPRVILSTHSPNVLKYVVRLFKTKQQVIHFSKPKGHGTKVSKLNSQYNDARFLNIFSDNEARLFFSNFILFVEGATELEIFRNYKLCEKFTSLNAIDVYETNNVILKYLNPNYSRAAIPFLVLNDADVLIKFDYKKSKLTLDSSKYNFTEIAKKTHLDFYTEKNFREKSILEYINSQNGKITKFDSGRIGFDTFTIQNYVKLTNEILNKRNCHLTVTTIEGSLITEQSLYIFEKWLVSKFTRTMQYNGVNTDPTKWFKSLNSDLCSNKKSSTDIFNQIVSFNYTDCNLSDINSLFIKNVSTKHLKYCKSTILSYSQSPRVILNLLRVVFEGKTDNLLSRLNEDYSSTVDPQFKDLVKEVRTHYFKALQPIMGKTGGWVTDFLDFAIDHIDKNTNSNQDFTKKFAFTFPELFDIIRKVSSSIAKEDLYASRNG
ncbi:retron Eco8 family effector endonuclease [Vibrio brasiliensis]|uniref:retron Eco8 family effector endonuclease n=1 Tax=Vibrio brasiliensis TaxID=170652 RepID=UPI001EFDBABC|nr:retron Eco8 family effector endonuclease [Vibrio brasiliensis]MCG9647464.1 retron Eco8 family effector endonuclease [Vibrio brasiliensis]